MQLPDSSSLCNAIVITNPEATRTPGDHLLSTAERASSSQLLICVHELGRAAGFLKFLTVVVLLNHSTNLSVLQGKPRALILWIASELSNRLELVADEIAAAFLPLALLNQSELLAN